MTHDLDTLLLKALFPEMEEQYNARVNRLIEFLETEARGEIARGRSVEEAVAEAEHAEDPTQGPHDAPTERMFLMARGEVLRRLNQKSP